MHQHPDTFEARARAVLAGEENQQKLIELLALRRAQQDYFASLSEGISTHNRERPSANALNAKYNEFLQEIAELVGAAAYQDLFDFPPGTVIKLVDESQYPNAA